jgi:hypothetical protein
MANIIIGREYPMLRGEILRKNILSLLQTGKISPCNLLSMNEYKWIRTVANAE